MPKTSSMTSVARAWDAWRDPIEVSVLLFGGWLAAGLLAGWAQAIT